MKPQQNVMIYRTQNDTDAMAVILSVTNDAGTAFVADADEVVMHVRTTDGIVTITGTAKGDDSGTFYFAATTIKEYIGAMRFELQVTQDSDGVIFTAATGTISSVPELA